MPADEIQPSLADKLGFDAQILDNSGDYRLDASYEEQRHGYFAVRVSRFHDVTKSRAFVDKTLFIKDFFLQDYLQVSAPPHYCKSTNMDMVKAFCEVSVDENGTKVPRELTSNYSLFKTNQLDIYKDREFFDKHFGKYPVIHMDFKGLKTGTYKAFYNSIRKLIRKTFKAHSYLLKSTKVYQDMLEQFELFCVKRRIIRRRDSELHSSMKVLGRMLYTHFDETKCIVLIDGFDSPIDRALTTHTAIRDPDTSQIYDFLMNFISNTMSTNPFTHKGIINTCLRFAIDNVQNIKLIPFLKHPVLTKYYGFSKPEVDQLLSKFGFCSRYDDVTQFYGGHRDKLTGETVYDPLAIASYLENEKLRNCWIQEESGAARLPFGRVKHEVEKLVDDFDERKQGMQIRYNMGLSADQTVGLKHLMWSKKFLEPFDRDLLLQYLTDKGYFTVCKEDGLYSTIRIPNMQTHEEVKSILGSALQLQSEISSESDKH